MAIMLGNLPVSEIERRLSIELKEEDRKVFNENRQETVNRTPLAEGKWHCFDIPFLLMCDREETARKMADILSRYSLKGSIQIGWEK